MREYLEGLDEEALAETRTKRLSLTSGPLDRRSRRPSFCAYFTNYLINTEHGVIMDMESTPANRTVEVESELVEAQFDIKPERRIGDTA